MGLKGFKVRVFGFRAVGPECYTPNGFVHQDLTSYCCLFDTLIVLATLIRPLQKHLENKSLQAIIPSGIPYGTLYRIPFQGAYGQFSK